MEAGPDTLGNVRRIRGGKSYSLEKGDPASDLGGYRYTAFGRTVTAPDTSAPTVFTYLYQQPLRWQGRWYTEMAGGLYDFRSRVWSPELGAFLMPDEFGFLTRTGTLWSWPGQNPYTYGDPSGRGPLGRFVGTVIGGVLGMDIGALAGAAIGGGTTIETGPGVLVGVSGGALVGSATGAVALGMIGGNLGDQLGDLLDGPMLARKGDLREVDEIAHRLGQGREVVSRRLHDIKEAAGLRGKKVKIDRDGTVRDPVSGEEIGNLCDD